MPALRPLEFVDCVIDSPYFRENLCEHEKEIDHVNKGLKSIIGLINKYIEAVRQLKQAQCDLATSLKECPLAENTKYTLPDAAATDDEIRIQNSLIIFHDILIQNAEAIERMANCFVDGILEPLKAFREQRIGEAKEGRKKFDRLTSKYCQSLEKYLSTKAKTGETVLSEADHNNDKEKQTFHENSMLHVMMIQEVEEENKLRLVEALIILNKLLSAYYYEAQEALTNEMHTIESVKCAVQMAQDRFEHVRSSSKELMNKTLKKAPESIVSHTNGFFARQGYLFMLMKKAMTTVWSKYFCQYNKEGKQLLMYPYVQTNSSAKTHHSEQLRYKLVSCVRRATDSIDRRFCFDITVEDRNSVITLQAMSEEDMRLWLDVMDGKEPTYAIPASKTHGKSEVEETTLNEEGYLFLDMCIREIERRGLDEEGLYRLSGSTAKLSKFIQYAQDEKGFLQLRLDNTDEYDTKLLTSAVKKYLRLLSEPLMTFDLHDKFITAAKQKDLESRIAAVGNLISSLPAENHRVLTLLIHHFRKIADSSASNKMTPANLGIVIGPSIFRPAEESVAAIMDIKFAGVVVQIMVENCNRFFPDPPVSPNMALMASNQTTTLRGLRSQSMDSASTATGDGGTSSSSGHMSVPSAGGGGGSGLSYLTRQLSSKLRRSVRNSPSTPSQSSNSGDTSTGFGGGNGGGLGTGASNSSISSTSTATAGGASGGGSQGGSGSSSNASGLKLPRSPSRHGAHSPVMERAHLGSGIRKSGRALAARLSHPLGRPEKPTSPPSTMNGNGRCVRTKYRCVGEQDNELSFEANRIISNVRQSEEEGWLLGILDGREGLIPENYVEFLN